MEGFHTVKKHNSFSLPMIWVAADVSPLNLNAGSGQSRLTSAAMIHRCCKALLVLSLALIFSTVGAAETTTNDLAKVKVSGFGILGNREMSRLLRNFQPDGKLPVVVDRTFVEDATLILLSRAHDDGYLSATLSGDFTMTDGAQQHLAWTNAMDALLPREFAAREAHFTLQSGVRFYYQSLEFDGLKFFSKREASSYFVVGEALLKLRRNRIFSPGALNSSMAALREAYARAGYQDVVVSTNLVTWDESTGAVKVEVSVQEGLPTIVRSVVVQVHGGEKGSETNRTLIPDKPYSRLWQQALTQKLQASQQVKGFPDTTVEFSTLRRETNATSIQLDLSASVTTGSLIHVGKVIAKGNRRTKMSALKSRIKIAEGDALNRVEAEKSRQSLARLGVFDSVRLRYESVDETNRNVIYEVQEGKPISFSVLAGWGSYELLRGGLEFENRNLFGLAHDLRLRAVQSFKSSKGELYYTVPEVFGKDVNFFVQGSGLRREEVSFTREEFGSSIGIQKRLVPIKTDFTLRYVYEFLNALDVGSTNTNQTGVRDTKSAAFVLELHRDQLDNSLLPQRGLKLFSRLEIASESLGGNVDYQLLQFGASYHVDLTGGLLLHLGVTHGVSFTLGGTADQLPFNKRFFPGGENSVRGYQEGEASPLDAQGHQLGAETYTQANIELEQLVTKNWSVVTFFDAVGFAQHRADYSWDEGLYSVGAGLCWRSFIGPVRLEYGYNLNRRKFDPIGTLHFSIGFPF